MKYSIIISEQDVASMSIYKALLNETIPKNIEIIKFNKEPIFLDGIEANTKGGILVFATKHRAASGKKSLTCHFPGNWASAGMGGKENKLCIAPASALKEMFTNLKNNASEIKEYEVTLEATHHGPYLEKPAMFIELGSTEIDWTDENGARIIAKTIVESLAKEIPEKKTYIALGGMHYPQEFSKITYKTEIAISHICPKYMLSVLNKEILLHSMSRSLEKCSGIILDWKGLGEQKSKVVDLISSLNMEYIKSSDLL